MADEDVRSWASREGLSDSTVQALADEGFTSLDDIKLLSAEEVLESFQKTKLLLLKEYLALKKAIAKLSLGDSTAGPLSPSASSASSPTGRSFPAAAPQYGHGRDQPDFRSTTSGVGVPSCDQSGEDVRSWASRERLSDSTVQALADEGFTSLDDIKLLSAEEVLESFQKTKLLLLKEYLALKKAIAKLSLGDSTAGPLSPSAPSASSPTGRSFPAAAPQYGHGRDQPDFRSTTSGVGVPSCDQSGEDVRSWASRERLSDSTVQALADEGFTSLDDIKLLSAEEVLESFQKTKLLLLKEYLALKKAIAKLSLGDSTADPLSPSAPSASSPTGRSFPAAAPQYGHGRDQPDFRSTTSGVGVPSCDQSGEDVRSWASRERLSDSTVQALADEGFTSLDDIKLLSAEEVLESFQKTKLLLLKEYLALKKAIAKLSLGDSTAGPLSPSASSASSPTGRSFPAAAPQYGHGRDQPDFRSTTSGVGVPSCDQSGEDLRSWASREGLSDSTVQALADEGFTSLDDIKLLSAEEVLESFQKTKLLNFKHCLDLKKTIARLSLGDSTAAPLSPSAPSASSPTVRSFPAAAPQYGHGRDQPDFGSTTSGCDESGEDVQSWASREGLSDKIVQVLADEGFNSLDDIKGLSSDAVTEGFQKTKLLNFKHCLDLKKAIARLSLGDSTAAPLSPSAPSASSPTGRSFPVAAPQYGHGRDQPDFGSTTSGCDESRVDPLMLTQPTPGHVKSAKAKFDQQQQRSAGNQPFQQQRSAGDQQFGRSWTTDQESKPKSASGHLAAGYKAIKNVFGKTELEEEFRFILLGKTGSGKSTTGNTILREKNFTCAMNFGSVTRECELRSSEKDGRLIEMMDCPGLYDTTKTQQEISVIIVQAVACTHPGPHAILYVIRLGRYTSEEFGVFNRLKALFDENVVKYMIVLFTGGDDLEKEGKTLADLMQHAPKELIQVVEECGNRCLLFNNNAKNTKPQVDELLKMVRKMNEENNHVPYNCPKYFMVGEGLEKEVNKRLAEVNKRDLEREKYVQELEAKTHEKEETVKMLEEEIRRKDQQRERELKEQKEKLKLEAEKFRKMLEADKEKSSSVKEKEIKSFAEIVLQQQEKLKKEIEEARERDRLELEQREREREELEEKRRAAVREEQERKERAYQEEMRRMKEGIAKNEEQGWVDWAAGGVASVIAAPFKLIGALFS